MKIKSFENFSLLGLVLIGVSSLAAVAFSSKTGAGKDRVPNNGRAINSTAGGGVTVIFTAIGGNRSYTRTGSPCDERDGLSATSADDKCTLTTEMCWSTAAGTTALANEDQGCLNDDKSASSN